jgi:hypothetical protein
LEPCQYYVKYFFYFGFDICIAKQRNEGEPFASLSLIQGIEPLGIIKEYQMYRYEILLISMKAPGVNCALLLMYCFEVKQRYAFVFFAHKPTFQFTVTFEEAFEYEN